MVFCERNPIRIKKRIKMRIIIIIIYIMSYNTKEELLEQSTQDLGSYLSTLYVYKTKIFMKPNEKTTDFKKRKDALKASKPKLFEKLDVGSMTKEEKISAILELERHENVGELPSDVNYKVLLQNEKEIGKIIIGTKVGDKKKALNNIENTPETKKGDVLVLLGFPKEQTTETTQAPETAIQQQAQSSVGADPTTIIDKPQRGRPKKLSKTQIKEVADDLIILGYKNRLHELEKIEPEKVTEKDLEDMRQLEIILSYRMYKKTVDVKNPLKGEEYLSRIKKLVGKKEGTMVNPTDPLIAVAQQSNDAMREQPPPRQIASVQAEPSQEEQKQEYEVKLAPAQPQQQAQQQAPQSPQSPKIPPKISNILGGAKQPAPAQPQAVVANASATNGSGDKSIGNVREIGIGAFDQLAKADEVIPPESQRQKSLAVFANMKWIPKGGNNNSVLADLSPFQKLDDIEYNLRYGRTFKINAKRQVQDYHKPAMLKRCASLFTQPQFTPNTKIITVMQPSTPIGFAESNDNKTRNVLINEKEFDKLLPKYSDRPKKYNALSASHGLESYYPNEMIMPPGKDPLQNSSIVIHPDTGTSYFT
jgi:hypothetical protein